MLGQSIDAALSIEDRQREATSLTNLAPLDIGTRRPDAALPLLGESTGSTTVRRTTASLSRPARAGVPALHHARASPGIDLRTDSEDVQRSCLARVNRPATLENLMDTTGSTRSRS